MQRMFIALPILLPLVLLVVPGCPKEPAKEPSLPKAIQDKPGGPGKTPLTLPAGAWLVEGIADAERLAVGDDHACVIRAGGRVFCWGDNTRGALGLSEKKVFETPEEIPEAADAVELAAGTSTTCVRKKSGVVFCWSGPLPEDPKDPEDVESLLDQPDASREMETLKGARTIGVGFMFACGTFDDGKVRCERTPIYRQYTSTFHLPTEVAGLADATGVSVGFQHACARLSNGQARCWGSNWGGEIGNGGDGAQDDPTSPVGALEMTSELYEKSYSSCPGVNAAACGQKLEVKDLSLSHSGACAALKDGGVVCWGSFELRDVDFLNLGKLGFARVPIRVGGFSDATAVAAGGWHVCALVKDGGVACAGFNGKGQLGDGTKNDSKTARLIPRLTGMTQIGAGDTFTCALHGSGQVVCWGAYR